MRLSAVDEGAMQTPSDTMWGLVTLLAGAGVAFAIHHRTPEHAAPEDAACAALRLELEELEIAAEEPVPCQEMAGGDGTADAASDAFETCEGGNPALDEIDALRDRLSDC